jgi:hypothetical protein
MCLCKPSARSCKSLPEGYEYYISCESGKSYDGGLTLGTAARTRTKEVEGVRYRVA